MLKKTKKTKAKPRVIKNSAYFEKLARENLAGWQRAQADYQNLVKRTVAEQQEIRKQANTDLILELLPILDNFQHATNHLPPELADNSWVQGIMFIRTQLENILENQGVKSFVSVGKKFDPAKHEAVAKAKAKDREKVDTVFAETQRGYEMNGRIIRAARVKVYI
jgi:molecular chaperone GrpE